ncbi:hypothetical protein A9J41_01690 [Laribacter hongkongensis]|nr:hypothetical protein [Laribacter hongkongensis]
MYLHWFALAWPQIFQIFEQLYFECDQLFSALLQLLSLLESCLLLIDQQHETSKMQLLPLHFAWLSQ